VANAKAAAAKEAAERRTKQVEEDAQRLRDQLRERQAAGEELRATRSVLESKTATAAAAEKRASDLETRLRDAQDEVRALKKSEFEASQRSRTLESELGDTKRKLAAAERGAARSSIPNGRDPQQSFDSGVGSSQQGDEVSIRTLQTAGDGAAPQVGRQYNTSLQFPGSDILGRLSPLSRPTNSPDSRASAAPLTPKDSASQLRSLGTPDRTAVQRVQPAESLTDSVDSRTGMNRTPNRSRQQIGVATIAPQARTPIAGGSQTMDPSQGWAAGSQALAITDLVVRETADLNSPVVATLAAGTKVSLGGETDRVTDPSSHLPVARAFVTSPVAGWITPKQRIRPVDTAAPRATSPSATVSLRPYTPAVSSTTGNTTTLRRPVSTLGRATPPNTRTVGAKPGASVTPPTLRPADKPGPSTTYSSRLGASERTSPTPNRAIGSRPAASTVTAPSATRYR